MESIVLNHKKYVLALFNAFSANKKFENYVFEWNSNSSKLIWRLSQNSHTIYQYEFDRDQLELRSIDEADIIKFFISEYEKFLTPSIEAIKLSEAGRKKKVDYDVLITKHGFTDKMVLSKVVTTPYLTALVGDNGNIQLKIVNTGEIRDVVNEFNITQYEFKSMYKAIMDKVDIKFNSIDKLKTKKQYVVSATINGQTQWIIDGAYIKDTTPFTPNYQLAKNYNSYEAAEEIIKQLLGNYPGINIECIKEDVSDPGNNFLLRVDDNTEILFTVPEKDNGDIIISTTHQNIQVSLAALEETIEKVKNYKKSKKSIDIDSKSTSDNNYVISVKDFHGDIKKYVDMSRAGKNLFTENINEATLFSKDRVDETVSSLRSNQQLNSWNYKIEEF